MDDLVRERRQLAEQLHADEPAADDHKREYFAFAFRDGLHVRALETLDDVVAKNNGIRERLEGKGVLRAGNHFLIRHGPQGQDQMVVRDFASLPGSGQIDEPLLQIDAPDGRFAEPRRSQKGSDWKAAMAYIEGPRADLEKQGCHEKEIVLADENDLDVGPAFAKSLQVAGGVDAAEAAAQDHDPRFRGFRTHEGYRVLPA